MTSDGLNLPDPGNSDRIREALEELALDAITTVRNMLDHGDTETRIAVVNKLLPQIQKLLAESATREVDEDTVRRDEARQIIASMWEPFGAKDKAS